MNTENNRLIANFIDKGFYTDIETEDFQTDWNELMEVIKKCYSLSDEQGDNYEDIYYALAELDIKKTHKAVVEFIKWHNEQKQN